VRCGKMPGGSEVRALFDELSALTSREQTARLVQLRRTSPALAGELETLLAADERADAVLKRFEAEARLALPVASEDPLGLVGRTVAHFQVAELLGAGGMGMVYRAEDTDLGRTVALKFPAPFVGASETVKQRFLREARAASTLDHPNVCTIHEVGETESGLLYLAMAHYEGETLSARLRRGPLSVDEVVDVARQVAGGLGSAHEKGIVHRDIKPSNLILTEGGGVKILDFGLAHMTDVPVTGGPVMGTLAYMAPEQLRGGPVDERADLWALGVVLYESLTGTRPFPSKDPADLLSTMENGPEPPSSYRGDVPDVLENAVLQLLRSDPDDRPADTRSLLASPAFARAPVNRSHSRKVPRPQRWQAWLAPAIAAVSLITALGLGQWRRSPPQPGLGASGSAARAPSLAVLPFRSITPDSTPAYVLQGLQGSLIAELSPTLEVRAQRSTLHFADGQSSVREIGEALGANVLVTGTVRRTGGRVETRISLVEASSGRTLWGESYAGELSDVRALHRAMASGIEAAIAPTASPPPRGALAGRPGPDPEAYDLYLRGRFHWNRRSADGFARAVDYFSRAIAVDSTFAAAWAGLSDAHNLLGQYRQMPLAEAKRIARETADRALALDSTLAEAFTARAEIDFLDRQWDAAEARYRRAIELNPGYANARHFYGWFLSHLGRHEAAVEQLERASDLDPLSPIIGSELAMAYYNARRYEDAVDHARATLEFQPGFNRAELVRVLAHRAQGTLETAYAPGWPLPATLDAEPLVKASVLAALGRGAAARAMVASAVEGEGGRDALDPYGCLFIAAAHLQLGEEEEALDWLEEAVDRALSAGPISLHGPMWDPVRRHPRFLDVLERMDFPDPPTRGTHGAVQEAGSGFSS
jgi:serine/threonine protein kinase/tetratricopeptide (TPR) repeat protein